MIEKRVNLVSFSAQIHTETPVPGGNSHDNVVASHRVEARLPRLVGEFPLGMGGDVKISTEEEPPRLIVENSLFKKAELPLEAAIASGSPEITLRYTFPDRSGNMKLVFPSSELPKF